MKRTLAGTLAALVALSVWTGCGDDGGTPGGGECTEIGCQDGVTFKLGDLATEFETGLPVVVEVCFDALCSSFTVDAEAGSAVTCEAAQAGGSARCIVAQDGSIEIVDDLIGLKEPGGAHSVSARVRDAMDAVVFDDTQSLTLTEVRPNGADCPPVCNQGTVVFQPGS